jgi:hypothetical protein
VCRAGFLAGIFRMSGLARAVENDRYEQACDQAIAMCDGNLRSTIKALIMVNEYLEIELGELQASPSNRRTPARRPPSRHRTV